MREIGKALALVTQIGVSMIVPIFLCLVLGSFLDKIFHTGNILMIVFIILGVCAGFRSVYIMTKDFYKDKDTLGHAMGKEFRASLVILDEGFAKGIRKHIDTENQTIA